MQAMFQMIHAIVSKKKRNINLEDQIIMPCFILSVVSLTKKWGLDYK